MREFEDDELAENKNKDNLQSSEFRANLYKGKSNFRDIQISETVYKKRSKRGWLSLRLSV